MNTSKHLAHDRFGVCQGDVLAFHLIRMFRAACASHRLDILRLMIENGFDLQHAGMRTILHETVDAIRLDDSESDAHAQSLIRFLLDNGVDVNWQRKGDLFTALHIACSKNLYGIAYLLVLYGADVNAIALVRIHALLSLDHRRLPDNCTTTVERRDAAQVR